MIAERRSSTFSVQRSTFSLSACRSVAANEEVVQSRDRAGVAEWADARDLKSRGRKAVWVRSPPPAITYEDRSSSAGEETVCPCFALVVTDGAAAVLPLSVSKIVENLGENGDSRMGLVHIPDGNPSGLRKRPPLGFRLVKRPELGYNRTESRTTRHGKVRNPVLATTGVGSIGNDEVVGSSLQCNRLIG